MLKRCFIAINLPNDVRWELEALIAELTKENNDPAIKFSDPKQIHLTLHFLGDLNEAQIEMVKDILNGIAKKFVQTEMITQEIGAFPDLKRPSIIFLRTKELNSQSLIKMHKEIGEGLKKIGLETDTRPWIPHLTLARLKTPGRFQTGEVQPYELSIPIESIELMESELANDGPIHKVIESYNLNNS